MSKTASNCLLEPALQRWGRPWVLCASAVYTAAAAANNRGKTLFGCRKKLHSRGFGHYTPHQRYPTGVYAHTTRILRVSLRARPGRSRIAYNFKLISGCLRKLTMSCTADGGNDDVPGYFMTFRS